MPGQRIKDTELAEQLGVSRTPVREALLRLEREGVLSSQQHLGFTVKHLEKSEIQEVYPLVSLLECTALQAAPLPNPAKLKKLRDLCHSIKEGSDSLQRIELDSAWHKALIEENGNQHLIRILADLKRVLFRYEYMFMQAPDLVSESQTEHASILDALESGDRAKAVALLGAHWERCTKATLSVFHPDNQGPFADSAPRK